MTAHGDSEETAGTPASIEPLTDAGGADAGGAGGAGGAPLSELSPIVRLARPSVQALARMIAVIVVGAIMLYIAWRLRSVIRLVAISLFVSLALLPLVDSIDRRLRLPRAAIILVLFALLGVAVVLVGSVVVPSMVKEIGDLSRNAPKYARELRQNATFRHYDNRYHISSKLVTDAHQLPHELGKLVGSLRDVTVQAFSLIGQMVTILAIAFLLILHGREYAQLGLALTGSRQERYRRVIVDINRAVAGYVLGNCTISGLATIATWIVLSLLGVPYALSLAFVVGFFDLLPLVGATLGAIIVAFATLNAHFPESTLIWLGFIVVWQRVEDYVVQPLVYRRTIHVNPLVTIVAVLAGAELLGVLGALIAIPTAAAIQIVLREWWAGRTAGRVDPTAAVERA